MSGRAASGRRGRGRRGRGRRQPSSSISGGGRGRGRVSSVSPPSSYTPSPSQVVTSQPLLSVPSGSDIFSGSGAVESLGEGLPRKLTLGLEAAATATSLAPSSSKAAAGVDSSKFEVPEYLVSAEFDKLKGPLQAKRLPSEAWEEWCKEGVVCFSMGAMDLQKIYFANPRDLSIYHVADFVIDYEHNRFPGSIHSVACILFGSKIYMIGGIGVGHGDATDVYYCDVATQTQLLDGGYEWVRGPDLNSGKCTPYVFSLVGTIYVLSVENPQRPFEVLNSNLDRWELLRSPPSPLWIEDPEHYIQVRGSCTVDEGTKIIIHAIYRGPGPAAFEDYLFLYDAKVDGWTQMSFPHDHCLNSRRLISVYCIHVERCSGIISVEGQGGLYFSLDFESLYAKAFLSDLQGGDKDANLSSPTQCHILHLSGKKLCIIALFNYPCYAEEEESCYAGFATFDLDAHNKINGKRFQTAECCTSHPVMKIIRLHANARDFLPYEFCSKIAFSSC